MRQGGWKFTAIVGVVSVGLLTLLQAQKYLPLPGQNSREQVAATADELQLAQLDNPFGVDSGIATDAGAGRAKVSKPAKSFSSNKPGVTRLGRAQDVATEPAPFGTKTETDDEIPKFRPAKRTPEPVETPAETEPVPVMTTEEPYRRRSPTETPVRTVADPFDPFQSSAPAEDRSESAAPLVVEPVEPEPVMAPEPDPFESFEAKPQPREIAPSRSKRSADSVTPALPLRPSPKAEPDALDPFGAAEDTFTAPAVDRTVATVRPAIAVNTSEYGPVQLGPPVTYEQFEVARVSRGRQDAEPMPIARTPIDNGDPFGVVDEPPARAPIMPTSGDEEIVRPRRTGTREPDVAARPARREDTVPVAIAASPLAGQSMQQPRLTIEKQAPDRAILGQAVVYTISVKNMGTHEAREVVVEDETPAGADLVSTEPQAEVNGNQLVWKIGTLRASKEKTIRVKVIPREAGQIGSVARIRFATEVSAAIQVTAPQLSLEARSPEIAKLGENVPFSFRVKNIGQVDADAVKLVDLIPEGLNHSEGKSLEYEIGRLTVGESHDVTLDLIAMKAGAVENRVMLTTGGVMAAEKFIPLRIVSEEFSIEREGPERPYAGRAVVYENTVINTGESPIEGLTVTETVPKGLEFQEASEGGRYDNLTRLVTWKLPTIGVEGQRKVAVKYMARGAGDLTSTVTAVSAIGASAKMEARVSLYGLPAMTLEPLTGKKQIGVGEEIVIRVQIDNRGAATAQNVRLQAEVPPEFEYLDSSGEVRLEQRGDKLVSETIPTMDVNRPLEFEVRLRAVQSGDSHVEFALIADHLKKSLRRDQAVQIVP